MQHDDKTETLMRLNDFFGRGWQKAYADAIGLRRPTVSEMTGPTLKFTTAIARFFESVPHQKWPDQFNDLAELRKQKLAAEKAALHKETTTHDL